MKNTYRFTPTGYAIKVFRERFCPELNTSRAKKVLLRLACSAKPLGVTK